METANVQETTKAMDEELEIGSEQFNPLRLLYTMEHRVSKKQPKVIYQNLAALESAYKRHGIWNLNKSCPKPTPQGSTSAAIVSTSGASTSAAAAANVVVENPEDAIGQRRFLPHQMAIQRKRSDKPYKPHNVLCNMENITGPMAQLYRYVKDHVHLRVLTRREHGVRGCVEGYLLCFDKYWNLLMADVHEIWQRRKYTYGENKICGRAQDCTQQLKELGIELPEQHVKSINRKNVEISRHLSQLVLRGEQVVLIMAIKKEPPLQ